MFSVSQEQQNAHCAHKNMYNIPLQTVVIAIVYIEFTSFGTRPSGT